jgi:hypothetical protein
VGDTVWVALATEDGPEVFLGEVGGVARLGEGVLYYFDGWHSDFAERDVCDTPGAAFQRARDKCRAIADFRRRFRNQLESPGGGSR